MQTTNQDQESNPEQNNVTGVDNQAAEQSPAQTSAQVPVTEKQPTQHVSVDQTAAPIGQTPAANQQTQAAPIMEPQTQQTPAANQQTQASVVKPVTEMKKTAQKITEQGEEVAQGLQKLGSKLVVSTTHGKQLQPAVKQDEKVYAAVSYLPLLAIACIIFKPNSSFVRLHGRQGLMLFILFFLTLILVAIVTAFPVIGAILGVLFGLVPFGLMLLGFYSIYLALSGYWWKIPVIGQMAEIIPVESLAKMAKENLAGQVNIAKEDYENRQKTLGKEKAESVEKPVATQDAIPTSPESPNSVVKEESPKVEDKTVEEPKK